MPSWINSWIRETWILVAFQVGENQAGLVVPNQQEFGVDADAKRQVATRSKQGLLVALAPLQRSADAQLAGVAGNFVGENSGVVYHGAEFER